MPEDHSAPSLEIASKAIRYAFVYGTLRRGDDNDMNRLQPAPQFVGNASIAGVMYHFQAYPGVILGGDSQVVGEVYAITPALERQLDEIEELYPQQKDEYAKREIPVLVNGTLLTCIVYEINPLYVAGKPVIASGDWVKDR